MNRSILLLLLTLSGLYLPAQHLTKEFHKQRREELRTLLPSRSVAVFFSASVKNRSNDMDYLFHQNPDFYYLSGYKEPDATLLIFSDSVEFRGVRTNEAIFVRPRDKQQELWNGPRLGIQGTKDSLGFTYVYSSSDWNLNLIHSKHANIMLSIAEIRSVSEKEPHNLPPSALSDLMNKLREVKTPLEIEMIKHAVDISCIGQIEVMKALNPSMTELEAQGIHEFVFKKYGCQEVGYSSIVGAGNNACVLHYTESKKDLSTGELLLMDVGAEYEGYTADVTRTIPVNGKYTSEQKILYDIVKKAQEAGFEQCKVGNPFSSTHSASKKIIAAELLKLGIIQKAEDVHLYFPHGTSHYLGLDVHDRGSFGKFQPNTIITVEPGIYIPEGSPCDKKWWGIGIRIEDDILITENGWINLSKKAPRSTEDIEKMMRKKSPLNHFILPEIQSN